MSGSEQFASHIATSSVEEGLDFACNLISEVLAAHGESASECSGSVLSSLAQYITFRYVGESSLALEYLAGIGHDLGASANSHPQLWRQLQWVANELALEPEYVRALNLLIHQE